MGNKMSDSMRAEILKIALKMACAFIHDNSFNFITEESFEIIPFHSDGEELNFFVNKAYKEYCKQKESR